MQAFVVALVVFGCTVYAVWTLLPGALRRGIAQRVVHWPWPAPLARRLARAAQVPTGCGCDGCDAKPKAVPRSDAVQPITLHRGPRR